MIPEHKNVVIILFNENVDRHGHSWWMNYFTELKVLTNSYSNKAVRENKFSCAYSS